MSKYVLSTPHLLMLTNYGKAVEEENCTHFHQCLTSIHTGVLDLGIISNDTILLMISISTTFALPVTSRVSNEAKFFQKIKF